MKTILKIISITFLVVVLFSKETAARDLWLKDIPLKQLQNLYNEIEYTGTKGYLMLPSYKYPSVFLKNFPTDYSKISDEAERNALFIKILSPLALKINQAILSERGLISEINSNYEKNKKLTSKELDTLEKKASKYDIFTRLKASERTEFLLKELLTRIDIVPPSIMITAAAIETNWGTSRITKEANSLYKTLVWHTDKGLKPQGETEDDSYRIKIYPDIYRSMEEFALKINSHSVFSSMRNIRKERRARSDLVSGTLLAPYVYGNSMLSNYAGIFDYTMTYYELLVIDKSSLSDKVINDNIIKKYSSYVTKM
jgi:Bax protein